jgi:hypothetical protein
MVLEAPRRLAARSLPLPEIGDDDGFAHVGDSLEVGQTIR